MANIFLVGIEETTAIQISRALTVEQHRIEEKPGNAGVHDLIDADIVFAGGEPSQYLSLLRRVREERPAVPFVVVTHIPETTEWLDALEAGVTDYCSSPFEPRQIRWLMESALPSTAPQPSASGGRYLDRVLNKQPKLHQLRAALSELVPCSRNKALYHDKNMPAIPIAKLLIVDDEAAQMKGLQDTLQAEGYYAIGFTSAVAALVALREQAFDLVLTDLMMPEMDGVAFLRAAFEIDPTLAGIVMTGHGTLDTAVQAMQAGALDYILKPFRLSVVLPVLARALTVRRVRMENIELHQAVGMYELSKAVGSAVDFDTVLQKVADTAMAQSRVRAVSLLLTGGKDGQELHVAAARGENAEAVRGKRIGFSEGLSEWLARSREPDQPADVKSSLAAPLSGIPGNVSIAMTAGGNFVGILHFSLYPGGPIAPGQTKALNILASAAASAFKATSLREKVRAADKQYRRLTENAADIIFRYDLHPAPHLAYVNQAITSATGYSPAEYYADADDLALKIVHPDDRALMATVLRGEFTNGCTACIRLLHRNGNMVWIEQRAIQVMDQDGRLVAIEAVGRDVTDRKELEKRLDEGTMELRRSLVETTALLKEVHHRVKNNLQVICSLLSMQISCTHEPLSGPLNDAHSRVLSMALIHEQIYGSETLAELDFGAYIEALSGRIFSTYCVDPSRIHLELSVEPISISLDHAIPCGLILNELLSNSLKHAFTDGREGVIRVSLEQNGRGSAALAFADNGVGLPADFQVEHSRTLGLQVISALIRQLGAELSVTGERGAAFRFSWNLPEAGNLSARATGVHPSMLRAGSDLAGHAAQPLRCAFRHTW